MIHLSQPESSSYEDDFGIALTWICLLHYTVHYDDWSIQPLNMYSTAIEMLIVILIPCSQKKVSNQALGG